VLDEQRCTAGEIDDARRGKLYAWVAAMSIASSQADLRFARRYAMKRVMEKIEPQQDHERLQRFRPGQQVIFRNKPYTIQRRTTLASGEAAVVLQGDREQFIIGAQQFLANVK